MADTIMRSSLIDFHIAVFLNSTQYRGVSACSLNGTSLCRYYRQCQLHLRDTTCYRSKVSLILRIFANTLHYLNETCSVEWGSFWSSFHANRYNFRIVVRQNDVHVTVLVTMTTAYTAYITRVMNGFPSEYCHFRLVRKN